VPTHADDIVNAVIELGFLHPVDDRVLELLEQAAPSIGVALRSAAIAPNCRTPLRRPSASPRSCRSRARNCASPTRNWRSKAGR
jgi:hypothetical protein